jgi:D-beta-D-heptose 7-phosphate kinase/D-beta-D-heptose 1-phosphate adenosyltransferase
MTNDFINLMDSFEQLKVLVIGDAMLDVYLDGNVERVCREAPVPIVDINEHKRAPGGAANTAVNIKALGGQVAFLSVLGGDPEGVQLRRALETSGVSVEHLFTDPRRSTLVKNRISAASQILLRFDQGTTEPIDREVEKILIERLSMFFRTFDAVVISDYGYGLVTPGMIERIRELQQTSDPLTLVVDSKQLSDYRYLGVTAVKPNYDETVRLLGLKRSVSPEDIESYGEQILELTGSKIAAVTLDSKGALFFENGTPPYRTYAHPAKQAQATGAGDTFVSALALALTLGAPTPLAAELASAAAAVVVAKDGTTACSGQELREHFCMGGKSISDLYRLSEKISSYRHQGHSIVFTNGCFDIIHRGHIAYLNHAKALGDVLIVGINSDSSVRRLKGPERPINRLEDRIQVLTALSSVDHIVAFDEDTPANVIKVVRPDIFIKGGDYTLDTLPEAHLVRELGGRIEILPYLENQSTTGIIDRIRGVGSTARMSIGKEG